MGFSQASHFSHGISGHIHTLTHTDDGLLYNQRPKGPLNWEGPAAVRADPAAAGFTDGRGRPERQFSSAFNNSFEIIQPKTEILSSMCLSHFPTFGPPRVLFQST